MREHIARIAYLTRHWANDGSDTPEIEVLIDGTLVVNDGYHRICAAIARSDTQIIVDISGALDEAESILGVTIE